MISRLFVFCALLHYKVLACSELEAVTVEAIENEAVEFTLKLTQENNDYAKCSFASATIDEKLTNGSFLEVHNANNMTVYLSSLLGKCSLRFNKIQSNYDRQWEIVITNDKKECATRNFTINFFYYSNLLNNKYVSPLKGSSFMQYLLLEDELKSCHAIIDGTNISLSLTDEKATVPNGFKLENRLESVGRHKCGVRVNYVEANDPKTYSLYATAVDDKPYKAMFNFGLRRYQLDNLTLEMETGTSGYIPCNTTINDVYSDGYCSLYDPNGKRVAYRFRFCDYSTDVTIATLGYWRCAKDVPFAMQDVEQFILVKLKRPLAIEEIVEKSEKYTTIGCRSFKSARPPAYCRMAAPNGKQYFLHEGVVTDRFTTFTLNLNDSICSMEIRNPLRDDEKGTWKCYVDVYSVSIDVDGPGDVQYRRYVKENTRLNAQFLISCRVPYASEHCHVLSPNGTKYKPDASSKSSLGECEHLIEDVDKHDNGTWQCFFAREAGEPMDVIKYDVLVADDMFYYQEIDVNRGNDAALMCSTDGVGLEYCMYIAPNRDVYYVKDNQTSATISYNGQGLSYGDCGITIHNIGKEYEGKWQCVAKIRSGEESTTTLRVNVIDDNLVSAEPVLATAIGATCGIVIVLALGTGVFLYRKRKSRRSQGASNGGAEQIVFSRGSNSSNEDDRIELPIISSNQRPNYESASTNFN